MDDGDQDVPFSNATFLWRYLAHRAFDKLWRGKKRIMSRTEAYTLGRHLLGWPPSQEMHIAELTLDQCRQLISYVKAYRATTTGKRVRPKQLRRQVKEP